MPEFHLVPLMVANLEDSNIPKLIPVVGNELLGYPGDNFVVEVD
jgi:hypothetical protein